MTQTTNQISPSKAMGLHFHRLMVERGLRQVDFAAYCDANQTWVSDLCRGAIRWSDGAMWSAARFLDLEVGTFVAGADALRRDLERDPSLYERLRGEILGRRSAPAA